MTLNFAERGYASVNTVKAWINQYSRCNDFDCGDLIVDSVRASCEIYIGSLPRLHTVPNRHSAVYSAANSVLRLYIPTASKISGIEKYMAMHMIREWPSQYFTATDNVPPILAS